MKTSVRSRSLIVKLQWFLSAAASSWLALSLAAADLYAQVPDTAMPGPQEPTNSMMAGSPVTPYTAAVMGYMIWIGVLVSVLLIGGFLFINIGLLSKRDEDDIGHRDPSDVGLLENSMWPNEKHFRPRLPAEDEEDQYIIDHAQPQPHHVDPSILVREENMAHESSLRSKNLRVLKKQGRPKNAA
jgi:hypothetical protein